jgi:16S rRNA C1402 (ribose-2'-O) methylase RsmI
MRHTKTKKFRSYRGGMDEMLNAARARARATQTERIAASIERIQRVAQINLERDAALYRELTTLREYITRMDNLSTRNRTTRNIRRNQNSIIRNQ